MNKVIAKILAAAAMISTAACSASPSSASVSSASEETAEPAEINLYVLSGPTGIGALPLASQAEAGETFNTYHVTVTGANDEVVSAISNGDADIAAIATNLAATLYNKTEGGIEVLAVNTLGVLSMLSNGEEISSVSDLAGKTIYAPGQGANPEYILRYVLKGNGLDPDSDVTISFVSQGSDLLSVWETDPEAVIMAPQPVATTLKMQNENASVIFDMTEEWDKIADGSSTLMMGCVVVRTEFLEEHPSAVKAFLEEYAVSIETAQNDIEGTAELCEQYGIIAKAAIAAKAIPSCGLTYVDGSEMKAQLGGYLNVMYEADPKSVGGAVPGDDFYYEAE